jgi:hypothetical protein
MKTAKQPRMTRRVGDGRIAAEGRTVRAYDYRSSIVFQEAFRSVREAQAFVRLIARNR